jgi:hypothetical protein
VVAVFATQKLRRKKFFIPCEMNSEGKKSANCQLQGYEPRKTRKDNLKLHKAKGAADSLKGLTSPKRGNSF